MCKTILNVFSLIGSFDFRDNVLYYKAFDTHINTKLSLTFNAQRGTLYNQSLFCKSRMEFLEE